MWTCNPPTGPNRLHSQVQLVVQVGDVEEVAFLVDEHGKVGRVASAAAAVAQIGSVFQVSYPVACGLGCSYIAVCAVECHCCAEQGAMCPC
jgi:hypothetical protein